MRQKETPAVEIDRIDKYEDFNLIKCHPRTLVKYRNDDFWIEGIHYFRVGEK